MQGIELAALTTCMEALSLSVKALKSWAFAHHLCCGEFVLRSVNKKSSTKGTIGK